MNEFALGAWRELVPGIYRAVAEPESVNVGLVVGTEAALLVDTGSSPAQGRAIRESVAAVTDRPLVAVVVTHWHFDHAFGLAAFADLVSVGHESVATGSAAPEAAAEAARLGLGRRRSGPAEPASWWWRRPSTWAAAGSRSPISDAGTPTATWWWSCRTRTWSSPVT